MLLPSTPLCSVLALLCAAALRYSSLMFQVLLWTSTKVREHPLWSLRALSPPVRCCLPAPCLLPLCGCSCVCVLSCPPLCCPPLLVPAALALRCVLCFLVPPCLLVACLVFLPALLVLRSVFFCSNALIALARSLRKCVLAVLITVSEANAVTGFQVRGACYWDTIPQRKGKTATKKQTKNTSKQKKHKTQNQNKAQNNTRNKTSRSGMK